MLKIFPKFQNFNLYLKFQKQFSQETSSTLRFKNISRESNTYKILQKTPFNYKDGAGYIQTSTTDETSPKALRISTNITNKKHSILGYYEYTIDKSKEIINHGDIRTKQSERRKGLGEVLRLSSIIEFKENGIKTLDIVALPGAIPFHLKCKLKPNLTASDKALEILYDIKDNPNVRQYYREVAAQLVQKIKQQNTISLNKKTGKFVNKFIENFTKQHLHNWEDVQFSPLLPMVLTEDRLKQFASFYNKLFKKYGINYKI